MTKKKIQIHFVKELLIIFTLLGSGCSLFYKYAEELEPIDLAPYEGAWEGSMSVDGGSFTVEIDVADNWARVSTVWCSGRSWSEAGAISDDGVFSMRFMRTWYDYNTITEGEEHWYFLGRIIDVDAIGGIAGYSRWAKHALYPYDYLYDEDSDGTFSMARK